MKLSRATATSFAFGLALWPSVVVVGAEEQNLRRLPGNGRPEVESSGGCGDNGENCADCCADGFNGETFKIASKGKVPITQLICIESGGRVPSKASPCSDACVTACDGDANCFDYGDGASEGPC